MLCSLSFRKLIHAIICSVLLSGVVGLSPASLQAQAPSATSTAQASGTAKQEEAKGKKEAGEAKKKAGLVAKIFKKFSKEAEQAKKLEKESKDSLQVFGWHVYWLDSALDHYNYNALSTLSYYACTIGREDSSLTYTTPLWSSSSASRLIKLAKGDDCTVLLTVSCSDQSTLSYLLDHEEVQKEHFADLMKLIDSVQQADGITITFENLPPSRSAELTSYIKNLSSSLKASGKYLAMVLPGVDYGNEYDIKNLEPFVDQFVVEGYNYHDTRSSKPQPVAPLDGGEKWGPMSISRSVRDYLKAGLPKSKLILGLPAYGAVWEVDSLHGGKVRHRFVGHKHYGEIMAKINPQTTEYDSVSHTVSGHYSEKGKTYHCYFDNDKTLGHKMAWVKKQGLAGVAIWALGYDHGKKELWETIEKHSDVVKLPASSLEMEKMVAAKAAKKTAADTTGTAATVPKAEVPSFFQEHEAVFYNPRVLLVAGFILLISLLLGVLKSLFYPEVYTRLIIEDLKTYFKVTAVFMLIFVSLMLTLRLVFQDALLSGDIDRLESGSELPLTLQKYLWISGLIVWLAIQAFSIKTFFKLNTELP